MTCAVFPGVTGIVLAGGQGRRMGGQDKGLLNYQQQPLVKHIIDRLAPQVESIIINANRSHQQYQQFEYPVITDLLDGYQGPLSGMLAGMKQAETDYILTVPCDCPHISTQLRRRLLESLLLHQADIAVAHDGKRLQPVFSLMSTRLQADLQAWLASGERKIDLWMQRHRLVEVDFSDQQECFINFNHPEDITEYRPVEFPLPLLGFAAFSGTGKTSLLVKLIPELNARGLRLAVVKHAHHRFDIDVPGKDSYRMREAGASQVVVASRRLLALMHTHADRRDEPVLAECLSRLDQRHLDLVLVEGFKKEQFAKIELHRPELGKPLLYREDPSVIAFATDQPANLPLELPVLDLNNLTQIADFVVEFCRTQKQSMETA
ncbi:MAG: molybdenum cofactor guanylyltransferase [Methylophaga sp.]|nr:molybdenum cofactor guanylyltransferase [Methylophaga sp.]